jgi:type IV pilus assembly protein PilN
MIRINLLPYRDVRRQGQILQYIMVALVTLGVTIVLILSSYSWSTMQLVNTEDRLKNVQGENQALKRKIGELSKFKEVQAEVQRKLDLVDTLQRGRFRSLESMQGLSVAIPKNVWLTEVKDSGGTISISGVGESNRAVAAFMRALENQKVFSGVNLKLIRRESKGNVVMRSFSLTMNRIDPPVEAATGKVTGGNAL